MRPSSLIHWAAYSAPLLMILVIIWFAFGSESDAVRYFYDHRATHPILRESFEFLTDWSNPVFYALFGFGLLKAYKSNNHETVRFICILLVVQLVISVLAVFFLKMTIGRPRPGRGEWFDPLTAKSANHSLPSGHTTEIVGWTLPLTLRYEIPWLTVLFSLFIGLVGFSRIYLGWHHPSDVFFGWLLGSFGGMTTTILVSTSFFKRKGTA